MRNVHDPRGGFREISWNEGAATEALDAIHIRFTAHDADKGFGKMIARGNPQDAVIFEAHVSAALSRQMLERAKQAGVEICG
jgi:hypothetical protein